MRLHGHAQNCWDRFWCVLWQDRLSYHKDEKSAEDMCLAIGSNLHVTRLAGQNAPGTEEFDGMRPHSFMISFFSLQCQKWESAFFDAEDAPTLETWLQAIETVHQPAPNRHYIDDFSDYENNGVAETSSLNGWQDLDWSGVGQQGHMLLHQQNHDLTPTREATGLSQICLIGAASQCSTDIPSSQCETNKYPCEANACMPTSEGDPIPSLASQYYIDDESDYEDEAPEETSPWKGQQAQKWTAVVHDLEECWS